MKQISTESLFPSIVADFTYSDGDCFLTMYGGVVMNGFHVDPQERIERFVRCENITRFGRMLAAERDESERKILTELISQENDWKRGPGA
jgi:hypothetical protein